MTIFTIDGTLDLTVYDIGRG